MQPFQIIDGFRATQFVIDVNLRDIGNEESLVPPTSAGNCMNWIAGHILVSREDLLSLVGQGRFLTGVEAAHYVTGSPPLGPGKVCVNLSRLQSGLQRTNGVLIAALRGLSPTDLNRQIQPEMLPFRVEEPTFGTLLVLAMFHEAYHSGQLGLGRRLLGKDSGIGI